MVEASDRLKYAGPTLVPSYEPDFVLLDVAKELLENGFSVVIVNDGSKEKFNEVFSKLPQEVHYLSYEKNHGKGYALKYGLKYIKEKFSDCIIVTMDSDGQHKVSFQTERHTEKAAGCLQSGGSRLDIQN